MDRKILHPVKRYLEHYKSYLLVREVKWTIHNTLKQFREPKGFSLIPERPVRGNVLFSSRPAFDVLLAPGHPIPNTQTNYWHSMGMAKTFLDLGYRVDGI